MYVFLWRCRGQRSQFCACVDASERRISRKSVRSEVKASSSSELSRPPPIQSEGRVGSASPESALSLALRPHIWRASAGRLSSALSSSVRCQTTKLKLSLIKNHREAETPQTTASSCVFIQIRSTAGDGELHSSAGVRLLLLSVPSDQRKRRREQRVIAGLNPDIWTFVF